MIGLLRAGRTGLVSGRRGTWGLCRPWAPCNSWDAFRPLWVALCDDIAREPFHLEKNGGLRCHGVQLFICETL